MADGDAAFYLHTNVGNDPADLISDGPGEFYLHTNVGLENVPEVTRPGEFYLHTNIGSGPPIEYIPVKVQGWGIRWSNKDFEEVALDGQRTFANMLNVVDPP